MKRLTASKLPLLDHCTWWLTDDAEWTDDPPGVAARVGSFVGKCAEHQLLSIELPKADEFNLPPRDASRARRMWGFLETWLVAAMPKAAAPEIASYYDPATRKSTRLGRLESQRDYSKVPAGCIPGTPDVVTPEGVYDFKCTRFEPHGYWPQVLTCGMMSHPDGGTHALVHVTETGVRVFRKTVDMFDVRSTQSHLHRRLALVGQEGPTPGVHCSNNYCPARFTCSASYATQKAG